MKTIELNKQQVSIPTSWSEITLADYEQWSINGNHLQHLASICKVEVVALEAADENTLNEIMECLSFVLEKIEPAEWVEIEGVSYYITAPYDVRLGTMIDMETIHEEGCSTLLSDSLALLCKPLGEVYDGDAAKARGHLFRKQTCEKMLPLVHYFCNREQVLQEVFSQSVDVLFSAGQFVQESKDFMANENNMKQLSSRQRKKYASLVKSLEEQLAEI